MSELNVGQLYKQYQEDEEVPLLDPGVYEVEVVGASANESKGSVFPVYRMFSGPLKGRKILLGGFNFTPKATHIAFQNLSGHGLTKTFFDTSPSLQQIADALKGRIVRGQVVYNKNPNTNETQNQWAIGKMRLIATRDEAGQVVPVEGQTIAPPAPVESPPADPVAPTPTPAAPPSQPPVDPPAPPTPSEPDAQAAVGGVVPDPF